MSLILFVLVIEEARVVELLHEGLRRLVDVHVSHLRCSLIGGCLLFFLLLLLLLNLLELIEDVLVVKQRVREFVHERLTSEESLNAALDDGNLEQLVDCRSLRWVLLQHHLDDVGHGRREVLWQRGVLTLNDFLGQLVQGTGIEGRRQSSHLVKKNA